MEEMSCGLATTGTPFEYQRAVGNSFVILYKKDYHSSVGGGGLDVSGMIKIIEALNDAYQRGFHDCGIELMPKVMEK
jgi:hypothetical protein